MKPAAKNRNDLDALIASTPKRQYQDLPDKAKDDIRYLAARAAEGKAISFDGLKDYLQKTYNFSAGRVRMQNLLTEMGLKAWWSR